MISKRPLSIAGATVVALLLTIGTAHAEDPADELVARGEQLGKEGKYREALAKFHEAEEITPRAAHDCYIAVAHFRLEELTAARYYIARCKRRAGGKAPVEWFDAANSALGDATKDFAKLSISASENGVTVRLEPDVGLELSAPVELWVKPGLYTVHGESEAGDVKPQTVETKTGEASDVALAVVERKAPIEDKIEDPIIERPGGQTRASPVVGYAALGVGAAALGAAIYFHVDAFSLAEERDEFQGINEDRYNDLNDQAVTAQNWATGFYVAAGVATAAGAYFLWRAHRKNASLSAATDGESAMVTLSGRF